EATAKTAAASLFGVPLTVTRAAAYLNAGTGERSLTTIVVPGNQLTFNGSWRDRIHPDIRVQVPVPTVGVPWLPVKDHSLLQRPRPADITDLDGHVAALNAAARTMGEHVAVRLGLSRPFEHKDATTPAVCWLMADGFFSLSHPQP